MAAMPGNPARTNSRAIFTLMTQIASWSWPNAGITCGSGLPSNSARCGSLAPSSTTSPECHPVSSPIWRSNWQLAIGKPDCVVVYHEGRARWQHAREIRVRLGYRQFTDRSRIFASRDGCMPYVGQAPTGRACCSTERQRGLVSEEVLLPGASALERLVARIRDRAAHRLWRSLSRDITRAQREQLDGLLLAGDGGRPSPLDRLRDGPYLRGGAELAHAIERLDAASKARRHR
jgi:hypothetical protein